MAPRITLFLALCAVLCALAAGFDFPNAPKTYLPGVEQPAISAAGTFQIPDNRACVSARFIRNMKQNLARLDYGLPDETFSTMFFANATNITIVTKVNDTMVCQTSPANFSSSLGSIPFGKWVSTLNISNAQVAQYMTQNPQRLWYYDVMSNPNATAQRGWDQYWPEHPAPGEKQALGRVWFDTVNATAPGKNDAVWSPDKYCGKSAKQAAAIVNTDGPATRPRPSRQCPVSVGGCYWETQSPIWYPGSCWYCAGYWYYPAAVYRCVYTPVVVPWYSYQWCGYYWGWCYGKK